MTHRPNASTSDQMIDVDTIGAFELLKISDLAIAAAANPSATVKVRLDGAF